MAVNNQIEKLLKPVGLPVAYRMFKPYKDKPVPNPPYIVYLIDNENAHGADGKNFIFHITTLIISKKPGNTGISRDIRTEFTTDLLLSD